MEKLRKLAKTFTIIILVVFIIILISGAIGIELNYYFVSAFVIFLFIFLGLIGILSLYNIYKNIKVEPENTIRAIMSKFIILFLIAIFINYIKNKNLNIGYSFVFSLIGTLFTFSGI